MNKITNYKYIQDIIIKQRAYREGLITNFYLNEERCNFLIKKNYLFLQEYEKCSFILFKEDDFYHLYYIAVSNERLDNALKILMKNYPEVKFVTDIVGSDAVITEFSKLFELYGFEKYSKLFRMSRIKKDESNMESDFRIEYATPVWANQIKNILNIYFDKYSEQIPLSEEIDQWIVDKRIIGILEKDSIIGFVIFEINGLTSHLRYWFVAPEYRDKKIGSALLKRFFYECRNTKRELFWVIESNENAITRYEHYGFRSEPLFDQVLIKRHNNKINETANHRNSHRVAS